MCPCQGHWWFPFLNPMVSFQPSFYWPLNIICYTVHQFFLLGTLWLSQFQFFPHFICCSLLFSCTDSGSTPGPLNMRALRLKFESLLPELHSIGDYAQVLWIYIPFKHSWLQSLYIHPGLFPWPPGVYSTSIWISNRQLKLSLSTMTLQIRPSTDVLFPCLFHR